MDFSLLTNPVFVGLVGSIATGLLTWLATRTQRAPDIQTSLSKGTAELVDQYIRALDLSSRRALELTTQVDILQRKIDEQSATIAALQGTIDHYSDEIEDLNHRIAELTTAMTDAGLAPPPRRRRPPREPQPSAAADFALSLATLSLTGQPAGRAPVGATAAPSGPIEPPPWLAAGERAPGAPPAAAPAPDAQAT